MSEYLVAAYAVFWVGTFALVLTLSIRQRGVERDLRMLERRLERDEPTN